MIARRRKQKILTDFIFSRFFIAVSIVLLFFVIVGIAKEAPKSFRVEDEIEEMKMEIVSLESQNDEFSKLIQYLKSDEFIEQEAKLKLGLKYQGEGVVIIPDGDDVSEEHEGIENVSRNNPSKWWNYFFGN